MPHCDGRTELLPVPPVPLVPVTLLVLRIFLQTLQTAGDGESPFQTGFLCHACKEQPALGPWLGCKVLLPKQEGWKRDEVLSLEVRGDKQTAI